MDHVKSGLRELQIALTAPAAPDGSFSTSFSTALGTVEKLVEKLLAQGRPRAQEAEE